MPTIDELLQVGRDVQRELWPPGAGRERGRSPAARLAPDFFEHVAATAFGDLWSRPGLARRDRCLVTVAQLAALGHREQLRAHLVGARNGGLSVEELVEVLIHTSIYAGVPAAVEALAVAAEVFGVSDP